MKTLICADIRFNYMAESARGQDEASPLLQVRVISYPGGQDGSIFHSLIPQKNYFLAM